MLTSLRPEILIARPLPIEFKYTKTKNAFSSKEWSRMREQSEKENDDRCWACGIEKTKAAYHKRLEVHEIWEWNKKEIVFDKLCALCWMCHNYIHSDYILMFGFYGDNRVDNMFKHGFGVLKNANLKPLYNQVLNYLHFKGKSNEEALNLLIERGIEIPTRKKEPSYELIIGEYKYASI